MTKPTPKGFTLHISADKLLGACGFGLAAASASFGIYMTMHVPSASVAPGGDFSVFAQLAPRSHDMRRATHGPSTGSDDLDTSATASIPKSAGGASDEEAETTKIVPGIVLRSADDGAAEIDVQGRMRRVRVGDTIPGAGQVLEIVPGRPPVLRTSMGLIVAGR